jgi:NAD dependent epimerase/dehydratase family enzyme
MSWIHEADFIRAVEFLIKHEDLNGCVNLASPNPLPNRDFMRALRKAYGMPFGPPLAVWMLKIGTVFLRTEAELVLKSRRVVPRRLLEAGFEFFCPHWEDAAQDLVRRWRALPDYQT